MLQSRCQLLKIIIAFSWMTISVKCDSIKTSETCPPAEEGQRYTMNFTLANVQHNLSIQCEDYAIAICHIPLNCEDLFQDHFKTTFLFNQKISEISIMVTFFIASRDKERYWYVADKIELAGCYVNMFARAKIINCKETITDDKLNLFCWTSMIYPQAKCSISVTSEVKSVIVNTMMICKNIVLQDDPNYYTPNCSLTLPLQDIVPGKYSVIINMFPNVTNSDMDFNFGTHHVLTVNLEHPTVTLKDCPKIVIEHTEATCLCERSNSQINTSIGWFGNNKVQIALKSRPEVLTFDAVRAKTSEPRGFYCGVFNSFGWKTSTVWYSPTIISKLFKFNCTQNKQDEMFIFTCKTERIYPSALCSFGCNQSKHIILTEKTSYSHEIMSDDPTYFTTTCSINIPMEYIWMGECELTVTMYPNVTGADTDQQFGNTETFSISIEDSNALFHSPEISVLSYIVGGNIIICFIAFLAWCCKYRGNMNVNDNYDEINVEYISADRMRYEGNDKYNSEGYRQMETTLRENIPKDLLNKDTQYETIREEV